MGWGAGVSEEGTVEVVAEGGGCVNKINQSGSHLFVWRLWLID